MNTKTNRLLPTRAVKARFGDPSNMTIWRWVQRGILPEPVKINGRNYWHETDVDAVPEKAAKQ